MVGSGVGNALFFRCVWPPGFFSCKLEQGKITCKFLEEGWEAEFFLRRPPKICVEILDLASSPFVQLSGHILACV